MAVRCCRLRGERADTSDRVRNSPFAWAECGRARILPVSVKDKDRTVLVCGDEEPIASGDPFHGGDGTCRDGTGFVEAEVARGNRVVPYQITRVEADDDVQAIGAGGR